MMVAPEKPSLTLRFKKALSILSASSFGIRKP